MQFWFLRKSSILVQSAYLNLEHISLATYLDCDSNVNLVSRLFQSSLFVCYPVVNLKPARLFTWYFFLRGFVLLFLVSSMSQLGGVPRTPYAGLNNSFLQLPLSCTPPSVLEKVKRCLFVVIYLLQSEVECQGSAL